MFYKKEWLLKVFKKRKSAPYLLKILKALVMESVHKCTFIMMPHLAVL